MTFWTANQDASRSSCVPNLVTLSTLVFRLVERKVVVRAGSEVVRIDPLRFLAGDRKRRRNPELLSVLSLSTAF